MIKSEYKRKKLSSIAIMFVVMGTSIGAGIFFKAKNIADNSQQNFIMAIFSWIIAAIAVISMSLSLVEITSVENEDLSIIGWNKIFNNKLIYKMSKNFMLYLFMPLTFLFIPFLIVMFLQNSIAILSNSNSATFNTNFDWLIWFLITLSTTIYFLVITTFFAKIGSIQNLVTFVIKFIPIILVIIIGLVLIFTNNHSEISLKFNGKSVKELSKGASISNINGIGAAFGLFISISSVFFTYDGFYAGLGLQSEMKHPRHTPIVVLSGLILTTIIYLSVAISLSLNGGDISSLHDNFAKLVGKKSARITLGIINLTITIGIIGVLNNLSMWTPRFIQKLINRNEVLFSSYFKRKFNSQNKPIAGLLYSFMIIIPVITIFTLIGVYAYLPDSNLSKYGEGMDSLYNFLQLITNWCPLFSFLFVTLAIMGGLINRKTNKIATKKTKYFKASAWISIIIIFLSLFVVIILPFIDLVLLYQVENLASETKLIISRIATVVSLLIFVVFTTISTFIEIKIENNKKIFSN
ncbi:amino acid permease [Mycoplasma sp. Mirounga ES2805-ORL]|uniref:amino acid permease n=1 Tax=Mycoplasma sp. Mirounga ES2805-ORL TaxID=754514 RepID=UPI00197B14F0|nr:amino acid permease [Mycoplasma sp. Mirounga ES2805-ORL]QSF13940.1 amino acid permease [Mycoplasma sp. Mirounga ES2805-ORL]